MGSICHGIWEFSKPKTAWHHKIGSPKATNLNVQGKKLLITGGSKGIGLNVCIELAKMKLSAITMMARNVKIMEEAIEVVRKESKSQNPNIKLNYIKLDLADISSIKSSIDKLINNSYLNYDVVMLNAGVLMDGIDQKTNINNCFQINHLGTFAFGNYLLSSIAAKKETLSFPERILVTSSSGHLFASPAGIDVTDINFDKNSHPRHGHWLGETFNFYIQSKLSNLFYVQSLAKKVKEFNPKNPILVQAIHPGCVVSDIRGVRSERNSIAVWFENLILRSNLYGAQCHIHVAYSENADVVSVEENGGYWDSCHRDRILNMLAGVDVEKQREELWAFSVDSTGCDLQLL